MEHTHKEGWKYKENLNDSTGCNFPFPGGLRHRLHHLWSAPGDNRPDSPGSPGLQPTLVKVNSVSSEDLPVSGWKVLIKWRLFYCLRLHF